MIFLEEEEFKQLKKMAELEKRSVKNYVEVLILEKIKKELK